MVMTVQGLSRPLQTDKMCGPESLQEAADEVFRAGLRKYEEPGLRSAVLHGGFQKRIGDCIGHHHYGTPAPEKGRRQIDSAGRSVGFTGKTILSKTYRKAGEEHCTFGAGQCFRRFSQRSRRKGRQEPPAAEILSHDGVQFLIKVHFLVSSGFLMGNKKRPTYPMEIHGSYLWWEHPGRSPDK